MKEKINVVRSEDQLIKNLGSLMPESIQAYERIQILRHELMRPIDGISTKKDAIHIYLPLYGDLNGHFLYTLFVQNPTSSTDEKSMAAEIANIIVGHFLTNIEKTGVLSLTRPPQFVSMKKYLHYFQEKNNDFFHLATKYNVEIDGHKYESVLILVLRINNKG